MIETERLSLRPYTLADYTPYSAMCLDPEVVRYIGGNRYRRRMPGIAFYGMPDTGRCWATASLRWSRRRPADLSARQARSEEHRDGKECVSTCRSRWSAC